jgi:autotransporter-associated beta strand protein/T5SS/PEP-CTERM-associated repeat protein
MSGGTFAVNNWVAIGRNGGTGVLNLQGGAITKTNAGNSFIVGTNGTGTVNQTGGSVTVSEGETWIGENGLGVWDISGGSVSAQDFRVGRNGTGDATLALHGTANVQARDLSVGQNDASVGKMTVAENASVTVSRLLLGDEGTSSGTVTQSGGIVTITGGRGENRIGDAAGATGVYTLSAGSLTVSDNLHIGGNGKGTFNQTGGTATVGSFPSIGRSAGGIGIMNLSGGTFTQVNGRMIVGEEGTGTLNVSNTGLLDVTGEFLSVGQAATGNGTVNLNGGTIRTNYVGLGAGVGQFNFNGGTLQARRDEPDFIRAFTAANTEIQAGGAVIDTAGFNVTVNTAFDGVGGLRKKGPGTLSLSAANTYTGLTSVDAGVLAVTASGSIAGSIAVAAGATLDVTGLETGLAIGSANTLSGDGLVAGAVNLLSGGHISPGITSGTLTLQTGLTLADAGGSVLDFSLGTTSDLLAITSGTFLGNATGKTTINVTDAGGFAPGTYTLVSWTGATATGVNLSDFQLGNFPAGSAGTLQLGATSLQLTVVPEPGTSVLLLAGGSLLGLRRKMGRRASVPRPRL